MQATLVYFIRLIIVIGILSTTNARHGDASEMQKDDVSTPGRVTAVTLYRQGAKVTRKIEVPASAAPQRIRVTDLPEAVSHSSIRMDGDGGVRIRGTMDVPRIFQPSEDEVATLKQQLTQKRQWTKSKAELEQQAAVVEQNLRSLESMTDFGVDRFQADLKRGELDSEAIMSLFEFATERRRTLAESLYKLQESVQETEAQIEKLEQQLTSVSKSTATSDGRDMVVTVVAPEGGTLLVTYDVSRVGWDPRYSIRAATQQNITTHRLRMTAEIRQESGEDWLDVPVALASHRFGRRIVRPALIPLRVRGDAQVEQPGFSTVHGANVSSLRESWIDLHDWEAAMMANQTAGEEQIQELNSIVGVRRSLAKDAVEDIGDVSFSVTGKYSIPSANGNQEIAVFEKELAGELIHTVTPLISSFAFRSAEIINATGFDLPAGPLEVSLDGREIGQMKLPPIAAGQPMTVGFGTDRQVRTRRELMARDSEKAGANVKLTLKYRLVVSNLRDLPVSLRLLDRVPIAADNQSVRIEFTEQEQGRLSQDPLYLRMQRPLGVLRWDLTIPANRAGSESYDHLYGFTVERSESDLIVVDSVGQDPQEDLEFQKVNGGGMGGGMGGMM